MILFYVVAVTQLVIPVRFELCERNNYDEVFYSTRNAYPIGALLLIVQTLKQKFRIGAGV